MPRKRVLSGGPRIFLSFDVSKRVQRLLRARAALDGTTVGMVLLRMLERRGVGG